MSTYEALTVLGLQPRATSWEIKAAYRDLVKVWHPDRFGDDVRLHRKAEAQLQEINLAYEVLQGYEIEQQQGHVYEQRATLKVVRRYAYPPQPDPPAYTPRTETDFRAALKKQARAPLWLGAIGTVLIVMTVRYGCAGRAAEEAAASAVSTPVAPAAPMLKEPMVPASAAPVTDDPDGKKTDSITDGPTAEKKQGTDAVSVSVPATIVPASGTEKVSPGAISPGAVAVAVAKPLANPANAVPDYAGVSAVDQSSIEAACVVQKFSRGRVAYLKCAKKQLAELSRAPAEPDISDLDWAEREAITSACSNQASVKGPAVYRLCVIKKLEQKPHPIHLQ